jgi:hypothetical protein
VGFVKEGECDMDEFLFIIFPCLRQSASSKRILKDITPTQEPAADADFQYIKGR